MLNALPKRANESALGRFERPALRWLCEKLPAWIDPDRLTAIGFIGAIISAGAYALSQWDPLWLWLASLGLVINWFGDSLDGTLARFRNIERPLFGFYLDQNLDALAQFIFAIGIGLSGFVRVEIALLNLAVYLLLSINSLVQAIVTNVFNLTYGKIGLTEVRVGFIVVNTAMFFIPPARYPDLIGSFNYVEILSMAWVVTMLTAFLVNLRSMLRKLR